MNRLLVLTAALTLSAIGGGAAEAPRPDKSTNEAARLTGTYEAVSGEKFGAKLPDSKVQGMKVRFETGTITATDKDNKQLYAARFQLDISTSPWSITMTSTVPATAEVAPGIIQVDGDMLKLCYSLPGADRPAEFKTKDRQLLFVLKRIEK